MKQIAITILLVWLVADIIMGIKSQYEYSKKYESQWELAVKASSIPKKVEGIDKFVTALEVSSLTGDYNAIFLQTPNNSFDENLEALKSLQMRLHEISAMDIKSFEYQTALQQITQQEQNEASGMLYVFEGVWYKNNYIALWGWMGILQCTTLFFLLMAVGIWAVNDNY